MPELLREAEVLEMMMISALVMTKTMASLENDDTMDVDFVIDIIDKTENKVIFLKKAPSCIISILNAERTRSNRNRLRQMG